MIIMVLGQQNRRKNIKLLWRLLPVARLTALVALRLSRAPNGASRDLWYILLVEGPVEIFQIVSVFCFCDLQVLI
jgi:hypothetical protein